MARLRSDLILDGFHAFNHEPPRLSLCNCKTSWKTHDSNLMSQGMLLEKNPIFLLAIGISGESCRLLPPPLPIKAWRAFLVVTVIIMKGCLKLRDLDKLVEAGSHNLVQIL